ncbi:uncharacterized protein B0H18DRAFT_1126502 [Fomitopsis serialis]|uniref:uncharacterized protein n=1 Tax=Fomitopsis serialis TaxID=139415 RepID=UPI002007A028|nr:uncharacterized protein B0H18DRAFT_1126502 [Neoantrodia serialis]KAH9913183.1 hypothetical protein B0H18DRAFT_1126502 [Neoantrodia serialis]
MPVSVAVLMRSFHLAHGKRCIPSRNSDSPSIELNLADFRQLSFVIGANWAGWTRKVPMAWKADGFLLGHEPISVVCRYGQNTPIGGAGMEDIEMENWRRDRNYRKIRYVAFAIASQISCSEVEEWEERPIEDVMRRAPLYDSPDPRVREPIEDLAEVPLRDEDGREINLYDAHGRRVPRLQVAPFADTKICDVKVNLRTIGNAFKADYGQQYAMDEYNADNQGADDPNEVAYEGDDGDQDDDSRWDNYDNVLGDDGPVEPTISVYPQAFIRHIGNMQATGPPTSLNPFIKAINNRYRDKRRRSHLESVGDDGEGRGDSDDDDNDNDNDDNDDDNDDNDHHDSHIKALTAVAFQGYSKISHRVRPSAGMHETTHGLGGMALAGAYTAKGPARRVFQNVYSKVANGMPHHRYNERILEHDAPRELRVETAYQVDMNALTHEERTGVGLYQNILLPLVNAWTHPRVIDEFKQHLVVFKGEVSPAYTAWTTYGVTCVLEKIWDLNKDKVENVVNNPAADHKDEDLPPVSDIEIMALWERILAYAHTGNAKVLSPALMRRTLLLISLLSQGLPTVDPQVMSVTPNRATAVFIRPEHWPMKADSKEPANASKRAQTLTYGQAHFEMVFTRLRIYLASYHMAANRYLTLSGPLRHAAIIGEIFLHIFIADIKRLVATSVKENLAKQVRNRPITESSLGGGPDIIVRQEREARQKFLDRWMSASRPLSFTPGDTMAALLMAITEDASTIGLGLPNPTHQQLSLREFVQHLYRMGRPTNPDTLQSPLANGGSAASVLRVAVNAMIAHAPRDMREETISPTIKRMRSEALEKWVCRAFANAVQELQIHFVPAKSASTQGRPGRWACAFSWETLGKADAQSDLLREQAIDAALTPVQINNRNALEASRRAANDHVHVKWSASATPLQDLGEAMRREKLPEEFELPPNVLQLPGEPSAKYVRDTYTWVRRNFAHDNPVHKLALLCGIVISKVLPKVFYDEGAADAVLTGMTSSETIKIIRNLPWIAKDGETDNGRGVETSYRRGASDPGPYLVGFVTAMIAFLEPESPLRQHFAVARALGKPWTKRNSAKGIGHLLFARMGLAWVKGGRSCFRACRFINDWNFHDRATLIKMYDSFTASLGDLPHGPFDVALKLLGAKQALDLAHDGRMCYARAGIDESVRLNVDILDSHLPPSSPPMSIFDDDEWEDDTRSGRSTKRKSAKRSYETAFDVDEFEPGPSSRVQRRRRS